MITDNNFEVNDDYDDPFLEDFRNSKYQEQFEDEFEDRFKDGYEYELNSNEFKDYFELKNSMLSFKFSSNDANLKNLKSYPFFGDNGDKFPSWKDDAIGVPNIFLRSNIFTCSKKSIKDLILLKNHTIKSTQNYSIEYTGFQLYQETLDVFIAILHLARDKPLTKRLDISVSDILNLLGKNPSGKSNFDYCYLNIYLLYRCFFEITVILNKAQFFYLISDNEAHEYQMKDIEELQKKGIKTRSFKFQGVLFKNIQIKKEGNKKILSILFDPYFLSFLLGMGITKTDLNQRKKLCKCPLAKWLYGYYSSNRVPYYVFIETIKNLSGANNKSDASFYQKLNNALMEIKKISDFDFKIIDEETNCAKRKIQVIQNIKRNNICYRNEIFLDFMQNKINEFNKL